MEKDILYKKIKRELKTLPIDTEARVLYLLVEIRKVLEHNGVHNSTLRFYGDWVVHTNLYKSSTQRIFNLLSEDSHESVNIINFETLRCELKDFLTNYGLPTDIVDVNEFWVSFRENLIDILIDVPLIRKMGEAETVVGTFEFQRRTVTGVEFFIKDDNGEIVRRVSL